MSMPLPPPPLPAATDHAARIAAELDSTPERVEAGRRLATAGLIAVLRAMAEADDADATEAA